MTTSTTDYYPPDPVGRGRRRRRPMNQVDYHAYYKRHGMSPQEVDMLVRQGGVGKPGSPNIIEFQIFDTDFSNKMWNMYLWVLLILVISDVVVLTISSKRRKGIYLEIGALSFMFLTYIMYILWKREINKKHIYSMDPYIYIGERIINWELLFRTLYQIMFLLGVFGVITAIGINLDDISDILFKKHYSQLI